VIRRVSQPTQIPRLTTRPVHTEPERLVTTTRDARYVDRGTCPMCGVTELGIEYHGRLLTGAKVHTLASHTAGMRRVQNGEPRCLGAGMRIVFAGGVWKGAPEP
jgi:hypothetical protein